MGGEDARPSVRSVVDGFRFVKRSRVILGFMLVDTNAMVFGMPIALFPAIATHQFHDQHALGYLLSATAAGALVFSALGGWVNHVERQGVVVVIAAAVWGGSIALFGLTSQLWLAMTLLAIAGGADLISAVLRGTMLMELTPDAYRGRVNGIEFMQVASAPSLGNLEAGALASATSIRVSVVSGGLACVVGCGILAAAFPALLGTGVQLQRDFFARSVHEVAPELIGATLLFDGVGGVVVEVEAYDQEDPASHGFRGPTPRTEVMFGPPGYAYVYRSYGIHWCLNFVCDVEGGGGGAVRALEPTHGLDAMRARRGVDDERALCSGPGKLCQALAITGEHDGRALDEPPFELHARIDDPAIAVGPRIGITRAAELPWRYGLAGSRFLSRPLRP